MSLGERLDVTAGIRGWRPGRMIDERAAFVPKKEIHCERRPILEDVELRPLNCQRGLVYAALWVCTMDTEGAAKLLRMRECDVIGIALDRMASEFYHSKGL